MTSLISKTIGKYHLLEALGSGGMATVYRASQLPLERTVAVKVLHPHLMEQPAFRDRFLREAKAVASLRHSHIVQMYDYDCQDGVCYIALEFLDGHSLEDRLLTGQAQPGEPASLPLAEALKITRDVADALGYAHRQGVIHRDIKPANIMQNSDGRTVLTDFGIATLLHETRLTVEGGTSGTPSYMSPEQALGERGDERSDIYSLGAVLYQLVTGRLPFEADTLYGLIMMHVTDSPAPASEVNPAVPPTVEVIIQKAMAKDPGDRYQSAADLAADLSAFLAGQPVEVEPPPVRVQAEAAAKSSNKLLWGVVAAVVAALVAAVVWFNRPAAPAPPVEAAGDESINSMAALPPPNQPFSDTFDTNRVEWQESGPPIERRVAEGRYEVTVTAPGRAVTAIPEYLGQYDNFTYELDATLVEGQPESGYGLVFHRQDDENYYVFAVNGMQQWSIWRLQEGAWTELRGLPGGETWTDSEAVLPPGRANRLQMEVDGSAFNLYVNNQYLLQLTDDAAAFTGGGIGMYVASSRSAAEALARVQFDNLSLQPQAGLSMPSMTTDGR